MRRTVWKFALPVTDPTLQMQSGAQVLSIGPSEMPDVIWLWAEVDPEAEPETREFVVAGTGHPLPRDRGGFIGTVQAAHGLVWHVWYASREVPS